MCLICQETIATRKVSNLTQYHETKQNNFKDIFPQNSEVGTTQINAIMSSNEAVSRISVESMTQQEKATECSLRVSLILGEHKKYFSDAEIIVFSLE